MDEVINWINSTGPTYLFHRWRTSCVLCLTRDNHRVMKWDKKCERRDCCSWRTRTWKCFETIVLSSRTLRRYIGCSVYIADQFNHRVLRWSKGAQQGTVIVGGNERGGRTKQLNRPDGLSLDRQGNLYVVDCDNHRVQRFDIQNWVFFSFPSFFLHCNPFSAFVSLDSLINFTQSYSFSHPDRLANVRALPGPDLMEP